MDFNARPELAQVWALAVDAAERRLVTGSVDNQLRVYALDAPPTEQRTSVAEGAVGGTSVAEEEVRVVTLLGTVTRVSSERVASLDFDAAGSMLGVLGAGKALEVYKVRSEAEVQKKLKRRKKRQREKGEEGDDDGAVHWPLARRGAFAREPGERAAPCAARIDTPLCVLLRRWGCGGDDGGRGRRVPAAAGGYRLRLDRSSDGAPTPVSSCGLRESVDLSNFQTLIGFQQCRRRSAERRHRTARERTGWPTRKDSSRSNLAAPLGTLSSWASQTPFPIRHSFATACRCCGSRRRRGRSRSWAPPTTDARRRPWRWRCTTTRSRCTS
jgi:hypothetical protein